VAYGAIGAGIRAFPCIFPVSREITAETSSLVTASTASFQLLRALFRLATRSVPLPIGVAPGHGDRTPPHRGNHTLVAPSPGAVLRSLLWRRPTLGPRSGRCAR
jgi:hypothetical protein